MVLLTLGGCNADAPPASTATGTASPTYSNAASGVPGQIATPDDTGDWVRAAKDYASTRFSSLDQLTADTVKQLGVTFTFSTGATSGHEAAPLVVDHTMFIVTPWPNVLYALDLTQPGAPAKWTFKPKPLSAAKGVACCDVVNRGAAYADGVVFFNTLDNRTVAVDARTGELEWETTLGDINRGETMTMAPLVVKTRSSLATAVVLLPVGSVAIVLFAAYLSWTCWTMLRDETNMEGARHADQSSFLALRGLTISAVSLLLILTSYAPRYFLSPCE